MRASQTHDGFHWNVTREESIWGKLLWEELTYKEKNLYSISTLPSRTSLDYGFYNRRLEEFANAGRRGGKQKTLSFVACFSLHVGLTGELLIERKPT